MRGTLRRSSSDPGFMGSPARGQNLSVSFFISVVAFRPLHINYFDTSSFRLARPEGRRFPLLPPPHQHIGAYRSIRVDLAAESADFATALHVPKVHFPLPFLSRVTCPLSLLFVGIVCTQSLVFWHPSQGLCQKCNFYCFPRISGIH